nr:immunoglobulin heavy chain junction region [Mus musculus]
CAKAYYGSSSAWFAYW